VVHSSQQNIGSYRLLNLIRSGKTCQVWEVMHDAKNQRFALKVLLSEFHKNKEEVGYLRHESQVGQKLDHRRVIHIYDFGYDRENIYLAMELFPVPNLKQAIQQGVEALEPLAAKVIQQAAEGLAYFHAQGWVHRDIKPDNFLMRADGEVKLIDFALAQRPRRGLARLFPNKTKIAGTRSYMSPEQIRGQALDERADVYSFGCMLHELLGGKPPYTGVSTNDLLMKHLKASPPPLQAANRNVSDSFAQLVRRMLAKKPADRPKTMSDFLLEFRGLNLFKEPPAGKRA